MSGEVLPSVRKIAVLRANAIGDFIVTLPALEALREAYPEAEVVLLGKEWHAEFLAGRPGPVDRVVVVPPYPGVSEKAGYEPDQEQVESFFQRMAQERFDLALQMHGGGSNSNPFALRLGARVTAGLRTADAPPLDRWIRYMRRQNEVLRFLEVVALVGATRSRLEPRIAVLPEDREEAAAVLPEGGPPLVALHPGATDPERQWPAARFAAVGDALVGEGLRVVVTGTEDERERARAVRRSMRAEALDLAGRLSLRGLTGLLSRCVLAISNDSGPLHLAAAAGAPTVGIYSYFNLMNYGPLLQSRHRPAVSLRLEPEGCGGRVCSDRTCDLCVTYVSDVTVGEVLEQALDLLRYC